MIKSSSKVPSFMRGIAVIIVLLVGEISLYAKIFNHDAMASDSLTQLTWQDEPYSDAEEEAYLTGNTTQKVGTWEYANGYCANLSLGGYHDWRLPSVYELVTLSDDTKPAAPYVVEGINHLSSGSYWSATAKDSQSVWIANPQVGYLENDPKTLIFYTRCVRGKSLTIPTLMVLKKEGKLFFDLQKIDTLRRMGIVRNSMSIQ